MLTSNHTAEREGKKSKQGELWSGSVAVVVFLCNKKGHPIHHPSLPVPWFMKLFKIIQCSWVSWKTLPVLRPPSPCNEISKQLLILQWVHDPSGLTGLVVQHACLCFFGWKRASSHVPFSWLLRGCLTSATWSTDLQQVRLSAVSFKPSNALLSSARDALWCSYKRQQEQGDRWIETYKLKL